jgi:hypothetical protein
MFIINRCHVCGLVLRESHIQDEDAEGRMTHRKCTDPAVTDRQRHGLFLQCGLSVLVFVVDLNDQQHEVQVTRGMPVSLFKEAVAVHTGVPIADQRLLFRGGVLGDGTLDHYGITEHDVVLMEGRRQALVVEALQAVIRHERESTIACLRAELEQTRAERDEAYDSLRRLRYVAQDEINGTENDVIFSWVTDVVDELMNGELYGNAVRRG